LNNIAQY